MPTLEEAEAAFSQWRASKTRKYERIPENLIMMARGLVSDHGVIVIARRLRVSPRKLVPKEKPISGEFVEVPRVTDSGVIVVNLRLSPKREITVTLPAGNIMAVSELLKRISKL